MILAGISDILSYVLGSPLCPQLCTEIYKPVCGSDGKTYPSLCSLQSESCKTRGAVKFSYNGKCGM